MTGVETRPGPVWGPGAVLGLIRSGDAVTRAAIMTATGLSRSTVAARLELLTAAGYIDEQGSADSTGGRPAATLRVRPDNGVLLVADIGGEHIRTAVTDLACGLLRFREQLFDVARGPHEVLGRVKREFSALLRSRKLTQRDIRGIAIGVPGPVDFATGTVISPPIMSGWDGFAVGEHFRSLTGGPVLVDKDTNLLAMGEYQSAPANHHLLLVKAGTGIGAGLVLDGRLHRGQRGSAGDIGHVLAPGAAANGPVPECRCGNSGCLEAYAGGWAIVRDLRARGHDVSSTAEVVAAVRDGEAEAIRLLREAGRLLGQGVSEAVNLVGPSVVVVSGSLAYAGDHLLAGIREVVYRRSLPLATRDLPILASELAEQAGVLGGAAMAADALFDPAAVDAALAAS